MSERFQTYSEGRVWYAESEGTLDTQLDQGETFAYMNVGSVIDRALKTQSSRQVQEIYDPRALALLTGPDSIPILSKNTPADFIEYQSKIRGYIIRPFLVDFSDLRNGMPLHQLGEALKGKRVRPYIVTQELLTAADEMGFSVADMSKDTINSLYRFNNKADLHRFLTDHEVEDDLRARLLLEEGPHIVPAPHIVEGSNLVDMVRRKVEDYQLLYRSCTPYIEKVYEEHGVPFKQHPAGVMVRPAWGGGNYQAFYVKEDLETGGFILRTEDETIHADNLTEIQDLVATNYTDKYNIDGNEYVITRLMQVTESPAYLYYLTPDKQAHVFDAHGQLFEGTQCVGTCSWSTPPMQNGEYLYSGEPVDGQTRDEYLGMGRRTSEYLANHLSKSGVQGFGGIDMMVSGFYERALGVAVKDTEYENEAVGAVTIAEVNGRPTQAVMHTLTQAAIFKNVSGDPSALTHREAIEMFKNRGRSYQYYSHDKWPVRHESLLAYPHLLAGVNGRASGAYILMPSVNGSETTGIGIMGNSHDEIEFYKEEIAQLTKNGS